MAFPYISHARRPRCYIPARLLLLVLWVAIPGGLPLQAAVLSTEDRASDFPGSDQAFATPPIVRKQVRFWHRIFGQYPSTTILIHDSQHPEAIIDILDFKRQNLCPGCGRQTTRKQREVIATKFLERYQRGVTRFARIGDQARLYSGIEKRLHAVYRRDPGHLGELYSGRIRLRLQTGLADEFLAAASTARALFPKMEPIFLEHGIPSSLTRLPFVESMFNTKAVSKVGASGLWQFMPETAIRFLHLSDFIDERNAPLKATRAAARLLLQNFHELKSWPLAITAYNHGSIGIAKAVKTVGSRDIGDLIEHYQSPSFGFASRNFYAEFLAALFTFEQLERRGLVKDSVPLPQTETVSLPQPMSMKEILELSSLPPSILAELNPCLLPNTFTSHQMRPLPNGYQLEVPKSQASQVKSKLRQSHKTRYAWR